MRFKYFEQYYDDGGKEYNFDDLENVHSSKKFHYIPTGLENFIPEINKIRNDLDKIQDELEENGPRDEELQDAIDSLDSVLEKWKNIPLSMKVSKFNL